MTRLPHNDLPWLATMPITHANHNGAAGEITEGALVPHRRVAAVEVGETGASGVVIGQDVGKRTVNWNPEE